MLAHRSFPWINPDRIFILPFSPEYATLFHGLRGVSDILGILPQTHSGATFGNLLAIEVKMPGKHPTNEQAAFLKEINSRGGIGVCVHSVEELAKELERFI
jgi:hypothetical protein